MGSGSSKEKQKKKVKNDEDGEVEGGKGKRPTTTTTKATPRVVKVTSNSNTETTTTVTTKPSHSSFKVTPVSEEVILANITPAKSSLKKPTIAAPTDTNTNTSPAKKSVSYRPTVDESDASSTSSSKKEHRNSKENNANRTNVINRADDDDEDDDDENESSSASDANVNESDDLFDSSDFVSSSKNTNNNNRSARPMSGYASLSDYTRARAKSARNPENSLIQNPNFGTFTFTGTGKDVATFFDNDTLLYVDIETGETGVFPDEWWSQGFLSSQLAESDNQLNASSGSQHLASISSPSQNPPPSSPPAETSSSSSQKQPIASTTTTTHPFEYERSATFRDPDTNLLLTSHIYQLNRYVRFYYNESTSSWSKIPLSWELEIPEIKAMVSSIQEVFPHWENEHSLLAMLRDYNYEPQEVITKFSSVEYERDLENICFTRSASFDYGRSSLNHSANNTNANTAARPSTAIDVKAQLESLKSDNEILEQSLDAQSQQLALLTESERKLKAELDEARNTIRSMEEDMRAKDEAVVLLETELGSTKDQMGLLLEELTTLRDEVQNGASDGTGSGLQAILEQKEDEIARLTDSLLWTQQRLAKEESQTNRFQRLFQHLSSSVAKLYDEHEDTKAFAETLLKSYYPTAMRLFRPVTESMSRALQDMSDIRSKYLSECLQRKLLYNQLQELRGNIRVFVRCRNDERVMNSDDDALGIVCSQDDVVMRMDKGEKRFRFEKVFGMDDGQERVYEEVSPIITSCIDGYNVLIMAYGQTGSGKTFTMQGVPEAEGVNIRALKELFALTKSRTEVSFSFSVSCVEVYNEKIYDLLGVPDQPLEIRGRGTDGELQIMGLASLPATTYKQVVAILDKAFQQRTVAFTKMNSTSSRSHLVLSITVTGVNQLTKETTRGKLTLVDLAGSERVLKTQAEGQRLVEAAAINQSLSTLGQVFMALRNNNGHVPYRQSKLTLLLQDSLGGNAKCVVFVTVSPLKENMSESFSTLAWGDQIKMISLGTAKRNVVGRS